jgi:hypothetical protein
LGNGIRIPCQKAKPGAGVAPGELRISHAQAISSNEAPEIYVCISGDLRGGGRSRKGLSSNAPTRVGAFCVQWTVAAGIMSITPPSKLRTVTQRPVSREIFRATFAVAAASVYSSTMRRALAGECCRVRYRDDDQGDTFAHCGVRSPEDVSHSLR